MKEFLRVWVGSFSPRFAVRIKVGLSPENNRRQVWPHSQPHRMHKNENRHSSIISQAQTRKGLGHAIKMKQRLSFPGENTPEVKLILCINTHVLIWGINDSTEKQVWWLVIQASWHNGAWAVVRDDVLRQARVPLKVTKGTDPTEPTFRSLGALTSFLSSERSCAISESYYYPCLTRGDHRSLEVIPLSLCPLAFSLVPGQSQRALEITHSSLQKAWHEPF